MARAITDPGELLRVLELGPEWLEPARQAAALFPLRVPSSFVERMQKGNPEDPLLLQVLPLGAETKAIPGFCSDPVGDLDAMAVPGLIHKYAERVLLTATGACAVHCRYCFRRHFPYAEANAAAGQWQQTLDYVAANPEIHEVILSGGDPLSLNDARLADLTLRLAAIPQLRRIRIHTRLPIVLPARVTDELLAWIGACPLPVVVVVHVNHANEIDAATATALRSLAQASSALLNQTVLLRGINDEVETLVRLNERLFEAGVLPYYLHLLDRVQGAAHFDVLEERAVSLLDGLLARLPGYLVPRLVRETAGRTSKTPVWS